MYKKGIHRAAAEMMLCMHKKEMSQCPVGYNAVDIKTSINTRRPRSMPQGGTIMKYPRLCDVLVLI